MSRYFVRASFLLTILLLVGQKESLFGGDHSCNCSKNHASYESLPVPEIATAPVEMAVPVEMHGSVQGQAHWQPGGYEGRIGSPYYYQESPTYGMMSSTYGQYGYASYGEYASHGSYASDPYTAHFGPGFYRNNEAGHYRFPYYSYRRPWYYPGHPVYNRDTNFAW